MTRASDLAPVRSLVSGLLEEHRQIDQTLALLAVAPVHRRTLRRVVSELAAHLEAEAALLHPRLERGMTKPLRTLKDMHARVHRAASLLSAAADQGAVRAGCVQELRILFREHADFAERVALPALEAMMLTPPRARRQSATPWAEDPRCA